MVMILLLIFSNYRDCIIQYESKVIKGIIEKIKQGFNELDYIFNK